MADPARILLKDASYDGQLGRTLATATVHAADLGEALATARRVGKLNGQDWLDAWSATAATAKTAAAMALTAGDRVSARNAFLRASEYYRQAFYFVRSDLDDPRLLDTYRAHVEAFTEARKLMDHPAELVTIPFEGTSLTGYLFAPDASGKPGPTLMMPCGYDSTAESGWYGVPAALERGYTVLVFEGPGQGGALYNDRLYFRPEFETILTPWLDFLLTRTEVDAARVALVGRSFAGYLAPRAAAFEHRLAALICDPAQPDMAAHLPHGIAAKVAGPVVRAQSKFDDNRAEFFGARMVTHGITSIEDYFSELRRFNMLPVAGRISCPTLIVEAENDFAGGGGQSLADAMSIPADLVKLTAEQGADGHCGGIGQEVWAGTVYPWLARILAYGEPAADEEASNHSATP
jgi:hypothetical protein